MVATKTLLVVASKDGELKSGYIKKYESEPENFSIRESEDGEVEWYYSKPLDVETYTSKLLSSVKDIYTYSPKAMNAMATVEGLSASPDITDENKHFLFSKTTNLPVLKHSYFGNASLLGYAMSLTFIVKTSEGYGSIYSLVENNKGLVRDIFEKSILNEYACDITDVLDQDMENKNSFEHQSNVTVNNLLKQIYFPVNNREHHLLVIMNHPGLRKCFSQYMTLLRDSSFYYQGRN